MNRLGTGTLFQRLFSTSRSACAPKPKKSAEQVRNLQRKADKKEAKIARNARRPAQDNPLYMPVPLALRYLRAAEVGRPTNEAVITIQTRVVSKKGVTPIQGNIRLTRPITDSQILVFASDPAMQEAARASGAKVAGGKDLVEKIASGELDLSVFDRAVSTPEMVPSLRAIARKLGPKGLMPTPKRGTVVEDVSSYITNNLALQPFRQKNNCVALTIARCDFSDEEVVGNVLSVSDAVRQAIVDAKSKNPIIVGQTVLSTTHGPGIVIDF
ncbi:hypothetical protein OGAPHI_000787 [Ogataea philodendri]|uniref:Ribosomal protein n=1 Tax=Ogataea philodendri TaxID=1378263 RepID=A0A9P8TAG6_9ASCO|nr:uncharacterized protein OGAPHI_000787 [Ogataea philodendri]KAH3671076.1 hypothetical protein OGAPHI_000787 [Ogataea philodendri]